MCVPLGGRRGGGWSWGDNFDYVYVEKITKAEVDDIILDNSYDCTFKLDESNNEEEYDGCYAKLSELLHCGTTKVKVAGSKTPGFVEGQRTVVMTVPHLGATVYFRKPLPKEEE